MSALDKAWSVLKSRTYPKPSDQPGSSNLMRPTPSFDEPMRHKKRTGLANLSLPHQDRAGSATPLRQAERRELLRPEEVEDEAADLDSELLEEEQQGERAHAMRMLQDFNRVKL